MSSNCMICLLISFLFLFSSCQDNPTPNTIPHTNTKIKIDGDPMDLAWQQTDWRAIDEKWLGNAYTKEDFEGRYKLAWDQDHLYVLAEIIDDQLIDQQADGLLKYWDDDCLEVFIDEDASGGNHQYNYNAFAYHISLENRVVDIGTDSLPHYYDHIKCVRETNGNKSIWELAITIYADDFIYEQENEKIKLQAKKKMGFAIAYCDNDQSKERENFIGSARVEGEDKNRGWIDAGIFEEFVLLK